MMRSIAARPSLLPALVAVAVVVTACGSGFEHDPALGARAQNQTSADPSRIYIPHPDDPCEQTADPSRWADAGVPDAGAMPPLVSAHRGAVTLAPENTIWAYKHAFAYGADVVEVDLRETLDGVIVSVHDSTVDRTTDGSGELALMTWAQVQALNAADFEPWVDTAYNPSRVPRLEEILELAASVGGGVEMDIKFIRNYLSLILLIDQYGLVESSYYAASGLGADLIRVVQPRARFIYNISGDETPEQLYAQTQQSSVFGSRLSKFNPENIAAIHDGCMLVIPHSYDEGWESEGEEWDRGRAIGMDGAQSDQPHIVRARQARLDPARKLPTVLVEGDQSTQVCLNNAFNGLGLPFLPLAISDGSSVQTGIDGCVDLALPVDQSQPRFLGNAALLPSQWAF